MDFSYYNNRKVLITGNTGFKGSWLTQVLLKCGADVVGYALNPSGETNLFHFLNLHKEVNTCYGDIRNYEKLEKFVKEQRPEVVFHLAAQPIVRESYNNPLYTYECNVMGTANIMECLRKTDTVKSFLNVTTDKVYQNNEWMWGYRECDVLDGFDPYSNSKSCSELVTATYKRSFFIQQDISISTARAGNVIGGGDFAKDRIVPDCFRAAGQKKDITVRNPNSVRPYQHVLESIVAYMLIAQMQIVHPDLAGNYNVGPDDRDCITTAELANVFCREWGNGQSWNTIEKNGPHEANYLKLDCSKIKAKMGWKPTWDAEEAIRKCVEWYKAYLNNEDMLNVTLKQIDLFMKEYR